MPGWLWALLGGAVVALGFGAYRLLTRRSAEREPVDTEAELDPAPAPMLRKPPGMSGPGMPRPDAPPPLSAVVPASPRSAEPFEIVLRPHRIALRANDVELELELLIGNRQPEAAENVRLQLTMLSANPDQDRHSAAYHASTMLGEGAVPPFDLASAAGGRMPLRLTLRREALHIVQVAGRPMFVPMVLVDLRWRSGISIRRFAADFMVGTAGQGERLGPIWLDRPGSGALAATRYLPRAAEVAA